MESLYFLFCGLFVGFLGGLYASAHLSDHYFNKDTEPRFARGSVAKKRVPRAQYRINK